jgi:uncharacterized protein YbjT (DUF2867 family)
MQEERMDSPIVVTGGTGVLGRAVVERLEEAGHRARVVSRRPAPDSGAGREWATADLLTGTGVAEGLAGSRAIVHCATSGTAAKEVEATAAVIDAAERAGCPHLVYISIVGVDRIPFPYYKGKLAAERLVETSRVPSTIVRATQFHDLLRVLFSGAARLPLMLVPGFRFQPVDVHEVAARLAAVAVGDPVGRAPDVGGPEVAHATELARTYLAATGRRRRIVPVRLPGQTFRAFRAGGNLVSDGVTGGITFAQYLAAHSDPAGLSYR